MATFLRDFFAETPEGLFLRKVLLDGGLVPWEEWHSMVYGTMLAPLTLAHRIPLYEALRAFCQDGTEAHYQQVVCLFDEAVKEDAERRAQLNGGMEWDDTARRMFGDIESIRIKMLGY